MDQFLGHQVEPLGGTFYTDEELEELASQHFRSSTARAGASPHEYPSLRTYILARRDG